MKRSNRKYYSAEKKVSISDGCQLPVTGFRPTLLTREG